MKRVWLRTRVRSAPANSRGGAVDAPTRTSRVAAATRGTDLGFHHTRPFWPVHIVVVPKRHVPSLTDLGGADVDLLHKVLDVVREVARSVEQTEGACRVLTNLGGYQDSKHLHFHVNAGDPL